MTDECCQCSARFCSQHVPWFDNDKWSHHTKHYGELVKCKDSQYTDNINAEVRGNPLFFVFPLVKQSSYSLTMFQKRKWWTFFLFTRTDCVSFQACGPTIPKDCNSITLYNGVCIQIDKLNRIGGPVPSSLEGKHVEFFSPSKAEVKTYQ